MKSLVFFLSLSLLIKHSVTITYRCDDDQIIVVQNFGNDTIRMHCQKPTLCGLRFLKCHYNHLQSYCGGKTNFVSHIQQATPIAPVIHTCCNLTINEDVQIKRTENDCFLYDLPDASNGTTAEELEKEDKEGYALLKNFDEVSDQFADFSGYRLRHYLLRKKEPSQLVIKGVERNEIGYRVTICSIQCKNDTEKVAKIIPDIDLNEKKPIIDDSNLNRIILTLRNLTNNEQWFVATWAEWSSKQWSEWSTERRIEFNDLYGIKGIGHRDRIHQKIDNKIKTNTGKGQQKSQDNKMSVHGTEKDNRRIDKTKDSSDCDDDDDDDQSDSTEVMNKKNVSRKEGKLKEHSEKFSNNGSKKKLLPEKQQFSGLNNQENLKSKSIPHKANETKRKEELFANRSKETKNVTKGRSKTTKTTTTVRGDGSNLKTQTNHTTIFPIISTTATIKEDRGHNGSFDNIKRVTKKIVLVEETGVKVKQNLIAKTNLPEEKLAISVNQTATDKKNNSKQTTNLKKKTFTENQKRQEEKKKYEKLKFGSTQLPPQSSTSPTRRNQTSHDAEHKKQQQQQQPVVDPPKPSKHCFSADTKVYTQNGEKTMKEISVGDFVLVPISKNQLRYERVEMFYHREPETRAKFVVLETESGRKLSVTELHLLPLGDCKQMHESMSDTGDIIDQWLWKSKFAHKARMGDCVFTVTSNHELQVDRIVKIGRQYLKGIYSPMTVEGSIVADGVLASCFSQVESHFSQKLVYDFLIFLTRIFGRLIQTFDEPIQHLPNFIDSIYNLGHFAVPFIKY
ncbi:unnamed protein product [Cercopithifilaria johnstoni]|uniref:Uncharacterized protein n=1 Tax=Cercopithifilaria johnstoni TaxID=2874296 RepID=A0A8J2PZF1_9BILA|nr:unnamed protein product [Cercopithifilaria johnstoni]